MRTLRRLLSGSAVLILAGCASAGGRDASQRRDRTLLTAEDLRGTPALNLYEAIRMQRPQWLTKRGVLSARPGGDGDIVVYQDGVRTGGPEVLRRLPPEAIESVHFMAAADATTRFGTDHPHGAIIVVSRRR